jgi:adenylate cyclase
MQKAIELGGDSWEVNRDAGRYFLNQRDIPAATRHYERAVELVDNDFHSWGMLSTCYQAAGDDAKLREAAKKMITESHAAVQQDPSNGAALGILAGGHALLGDKEKTSEWINRALLVDPENLNMRYNFACVLSILRDADGALKMLQGVLPLVGANQVRVAETDPDLDNIRCDPRFDAVLSKAKMRLGL